MTSQKRDILNEWTDLPEQIERALQNADGHRGTDGMTMAETAHHLLEANLVASNMVITALGADGYEFDWGWLFPDEAWRERLGYAHVPAEPALDLFRALTIYINKLLSRDRSVMQRTIRLRDSPDSEPYSITVEEILSREVDHAREHLDGDFDSFP